MTELRYFWVRENPVDPWEPAQIDGSRVYVTGVEEVGNLADYEIAGECLKPLDLAWREFFDAVAEALRIPQLLDWLTRRLR